MSLRKRLDEATHTTNSWVDPHQGVKNTVHLRLIEELGRRGETGLAPDEVERKVAGLLDNENTLLTRDDRSRLIMDIVHEALGYGPIEPLIRDPAITEVMINGPNSVYVEQAGKIHPTGIKFRDDQHVMRIIEKIVAAVGRRIDESQPYVDARLPDGSRVNAIIPPLALKGPCLTIRKFSREPYTDEDLIRFGTMTPEVRDLFRAAVRAKLNILISGGTGSGKTTLLNVVSMFIPESERIVTIEDAAELQLKQSH
ncbi:MAG: CpaF family protein, partial [Vicinamibacterales bacterium]